MTKLEKSKRKELSIIIKCILFDDAEKNYDIEMQINDKNCKNIME